MVRPKITGMSDMTGSWQPTETADGFGRTPPGAPSPVTNQDFSYENDFPRYAKKDIPYSSPEVRNYLNEQGLRTPKQIQTLGGNPMEGSIEQRLTSADVAELRNEADIAAQSKRYGITPEPTVVTYKDGKLLVDEDGALLRSDSMLDSVMNPIKKGLGSIIGQETADKYGTPITLASAAALYTLTADEEENIPGPSASSRKQKAYQAWSNIADKNSQEAINLHRTWYGQPQFTRAEYEKRAGKNHGRPDWWFKDYGMSVAGGGEVMGPGTGTSDSIPARLSDGEFVMTARAVENAGGGNRSLGAARMYDMMNRFERGAA